MKRCVCLLVLLCLLLSGCDKWMDGSYYNEMPHTPELSDEKEGVQPIANYNQLCDALEEAVDRGDEQLIVSVSRYQESLLEPNLEDGVNHILHNYPTGAYAVEEITYEQGTSGGLKVVAVTIRYNHNRSVLRRIRHVDTDAEAMRIIASALNELDDSIVVQIENYEKSNFAYLIQEYAGDHPDSVMEQPQVKISIYPDTGHTRLVEVNFTYQNSRDNLLTMRNYVQPVFTSAKMYVAGDVDESIRYSQLFSFLMERHDYKIETSNTPAYSLLRYGVGDSAAVAHVYGAMCRQSGLESQVVSGTKNGKSYYWNIIYEDEVYYHVDLLESRKAGKLVRLLDEDMQGYVWDYAAYPNCVLPGTTQIHIVG